MFLIKFRTSLKMILKSIYYFFIFEKQNFELLEILKVIPKITIKHTPTKHILLVSRWYFYFNGDLNCYNNNLKGPKEQEKNEEAEEWKINVVWFNKALGVGMAVKPICTVGFLAEPNQVS